VVFIYLFPNNQSDDEKSHLDNKYREEGLVSAAAGTDSRTAMIHATITGLEKDESADELASAGGGCADSNDLHSSWSRPVTGRSASCGRIMHL
jgi:hypothetical protein